MVLEALFHAEVKIKFSNPDSTSWSIGIYRADSPSGKFEYLTHASLSSNEYFSQFGIIGHPLGKEISVIDIDSTLDEEDVILLTQDELKLAPGFYFLTIKPHNAPKRTFKMIKQ